MDEDNKSYAESMEIWLKRMLLHLEDLKRDIAHRKQELETGKAILFLNEQELGLELQRYQQAFSDYHKWREEHGLNGES